jgi:hypothetical protein
MSFGKHGKLLPSSLVVCKIGRLHEMITSSLGYVAWEFNPSVFLTYPSVGLGRGCSISKKIQSPWDIQIAHPED